MLTAEELGLAPETYNALIAARDMLRSGKVRRIRTVVSDDGRLYAPAKDETPAAGRDEPTFNMGHWDNREAAPECGTCCCIWGWASHLAGFSDPHGPDLPKPQDPRLRAKLYELIVPHDDGKRQSNPYAEGPERAAEEIDNYLHGRPVWQCPNG